MNIQEASVTLAEAEEHLLLCAAARDLETARGNALEAVNLLQRFRNLWFDRARTISERHPPRIPTAPVRKSTTLLDLDAGPAGTDPHVGKIYYGNSGSAGGSWR